MKKELSKAIEETKTVEELGEKAYALGVEHTNRAYSDLLKTLNSNKEVFSEKILDLLMFGKNTIEHEKQQSPLAKENYDKAEHLWQELLGVVMINESGRTLSSEEIKSCRDALESHRPIKQ